MASAVDYGSHEAAMQRYFRDGYARAMALGNRGPIRFAADGSLDSAIVEAYERCGFYIFERVIAPAELAELEAAYIELLERVPATRISNAEPLPTWSWASAAESGVSADMLPAASAQGPLPRASTAAWSGIADSRSSARISR